MREKYSEERTRNTDKDTILNKEENQRDPIVWKRDLKGGSYCRGAEWGSDWNWYSRKETQPPYLQRGIERKIVLVDTAKEKTEGLSQTIRKVGHIRQYGCYVWGIISNCTLQISDLRATLLAEGTELSRFQAKATKPVDIWFGICFLSVLKSFGFPI